MVEVEVKVEVVFGVVFEVEVEVKVELEVKEVVTVAVMVIGMVELGVAEVGELALDLVVELEVELALEPELELEVLELFGGKDKGDDDEVASSEFFNCSLGKDVVIKLSFVASYSTLDFLFGECIGEGGGELMHMASNCKHSSFNPLDLRGKGLTLVRLPPPPPPPPPRGVDIKELTPRC